MSLDTCLKRDRLQPKERRLVDYVQARLGRMSATNLIVSLTDQVPFCETFSGEQAWIKAEAHKVGVEIKF